MQNGGNDPKNSAKAGHTAAASRASIVVILRSLWPAGAARQSALWLVAESTQIQHTLVAAPSHVLLTSLTARLTACCSCVTFCCASFAAATRRVVSQIVTLVLLCGCSAVLCL
jgi:hypothetical protein